MVAIEIKDMLRRSVNAPNIIRDPLYDLGVWRSIELLRAELRRDVQWSVGNGAPLSSCRPAE